MVLDFVTMSRFIMKMQSGFAEDHRRPTCSESVNFLSLCAFLQNAAALRKNCGLIMPASIDAFTGYRQYSAAQIPQIAQIAALRDVGFSIDEIGEILPHMDDKAFLEALLREEKALRETIAQDHARLTKLMQMSGELRKEQTIMLYEVELKKLDSVKVLSLRGIRFRNTIRRAFSGRNWESIWHRTTSPARAMVTRPILTRHTWKRTRMSRLRYPWMRSARAEEGLFSGISSGRACGDAALLRPV